jgi:hypothetical protein
MSLIGQPESYSDILKRIYYATLLTTFACTMIVNAIAPGFFGFLESWDVEIKVGPIEKIKAGLVIIPFAVALPCRMFKLHDRISDLFGIRKRFDLTYVLRPLAKTVGVEDSLDWKVIQRERDKIMNRVFYAYASFNEPKIRKQMVQTAADQWGWFWCCVEPLAVLVLFAIICAFMGTWLWVGVTLVFIALLLFVASHFWGEAKINARAQVDEIAATQVWRDEIRTEFLQVAGN